jgi:hypothetical protein
MGFQWMVYVWVWGHICLKEFANQRLVYSCNCHMGLLYGLVVLDKSHQILVAKNSMWHQITMAIV